MIYTTNITSISEPTSVVDNTSAESSNGASDGSSGGSTGATTVQSTGSTTDGTSAASTASPTTDGSSVGSTSSPTTSPATAAGATSTPAPDDCKHFRVLPGDIDDGKMCYDGMLPEDMKKADEAMDKKIAEKHPSS
jgi:hypothetical protein